MKFGHGQDSTASPLVPFCDGVLSQCIHSSFISLRCLDKLISFSQTVFRQTCLLTYTQIKDSLHQETPNVNTVNTNMHLAVLLLLLLSRFSRVRLCVTPQTAAHQAPPSLEFSRQEYWSGVPLPSLSCSTLIFKRAYANLWRRQWTKVHLIPKSTAFSPVCPLSTWHMPSSGQPSIYFTFFAGLAFYPHYKHHSQR